jgi:hypothetical protein
VLIFNLSFLSSLRDGDGIRIKRGKAAAASLPKKKKRKERRAKRFMNEAMSWKCYLCSALLFMLDAWADWKSSEVLSLITEIQSFHHQYSVARFINDSKCRLSD